MNGQNKYTVAQRLNILESRCTALEAENKELRTHLAGQLETKINDAKNLIQDSIRVPADGAPGRDGTNGVDGQSIVGPQGPRGDVLIVGESELAQAVIGLRRKLKEQHAKFIAVLVEHAEGQKKGTWVGQHFARLLEGIRADIERLQ